MNTSRQNFNLNDDNFWTNAFRLCEELQEADDEREEEKEGGEQGADSTISKNAESVSEEIPIDERPRLNLIILTRRDEEEEKGREEREEEEEEKETPPLPIEQWDAVKEPEKEEKPSLPAYDNWGELPPLPAHPPIHHHTGGGDSASTVVMRRQDPWLENSHAHNCHPMLTNQQHAPVMDDKYMEYYEFLSDGFSNLLDDVESERTALPSWLLDTGDIRCGADVEKPERSSSRYRHQRRPSKNGAGDSECSEKAGLSCAALKPTLYHQFNPGPEIYSRKVFVGGLPVDVDEDELLSTFSTFGPLSIDWPNKQMALNGSPDKSFPPKGYVFLIFHFEISVRKLVDACNSEDEKLFFSISSPMSPQKLVQIRPWKLADADYIVDVNMPINPRRVIFVGGVPRPIRAVELAHIMDKLYGSVVCAGIDTDLEYKYPKGAGRVAFTNEGSFIRAITDRYAQLSHGERVRVEMKPYVLDDQPCDECEGSMARHAPFFCPHLECLQYYCESCWTDLHACPTREHHKPLVKEA